MSVATNDENKVHATEEADTILKTEKVFEMSNSELENQSSESTCKINVNINSFKNCVVKLYDIFSNQKVVPHKTRKADMACDSQNIASKDSSYQATNQKEVLTTEYIVPVTSSTSLNDVINKDQCINSSQNSLCTEKNSFTCDICRKKFIRKSLLVNHIKIHTEVRKFTCEICQHKYKYQCSLTRHMRVTHMGIKPFSCSLCKYKSAENSHLVEHLRTHTGIKPFSCTLCDYKSATNSRLVKHMRTHSGIKPFSCTICDYKCAQSSTI
ncbi:oocyte zinc finger protein XlCOF28-like [Maniola jurtina]|uniref:oocyte zinc finger protein XlCOF28-like n=1 Tax=Maniola jurtina TaxID=191418 RepID=UPI001E68D090|nr:oocyte zinc finger protein XlCOF28-like [Maniola jurtina]